MAKSKKWTIRKFKIRPYLWDVLNTYLKPPEKITVSDWADKYRILDSKTSAISGKWRTSMTPYLRGIMDEFSNYFTEEIVFCKPTQVGGTEAILNILAYIVGMDPAATMVVYPTEEDARKISEKRIKPMMELSPETRKHFLPTSSTQFELQFDNMYMSLAWSGSPSALASQAIRFLFLDEVDKYPANTKKEASPIKLARERTKTYAHNRKILTTSTPTLKDGHIWKQLQECDIEKHYFVPCPHCGEYIELKWSQVRFPETDDNGDKMSDMDRAELAAYVCQECGCVINDSDKMGMLRHGEWRIVKQKTKYPRKVGFWMNTLYSPFVRFSQAVAEFLRSKDDPADLQNFVNSWLAEPWEDTRLRTSADLVMDRQTDTPQYVVPEWAKLLTGGVDIQETSMYWTIRAWGNHLTSQNIAHGQALSFDDIEDVMNLTYEREDGEKMMVSRCLIDAGYQQDNTLNFCIRNMDWASPVKGASNPLQGFYKISSINRVGASFNGIPFILVDGDKYKDMIAARMQRENGRGSWMVYDGCDREYAEQVTAEHKVNIKTQGGRTVQRWKQKQEHNDNHYLDCEVYAAAAADLCNVRTMYLQEEQQKKPEPRKPEPESPEESWIKQNEIGNDWIGGGYG